MECAAVIFVAPSVCCACTMCCTISSIACCHQEASLGNLRLCSPAERNKHTVHALSTPCCNNISSTIFFVVVVATFAGKAVGRLLHFIAFHCMVVAVVRLRALILFLSLVLLLALCLLFLWLLSTCLWHIAFTLSRYRHKPAQSTTTSALVFIVVVSQYSTVWWLLAKRC